MNKKNWLVIGAVVLIAFGVWFYSNNLIYKSPTLYGGLCSEDGYEFSSVHDCVDLELVLDNLYKRLWVCERETDGYSERWVSESGDMCDGLRNQIYNVYDRLRSCWSCYGVAI